MKTPSSPTPTKSLSHRSISAFLAVTALALCAAPAASADAVKTASGNVFFHNDIVSIGLGCNGHFGSRSDDCEENAPVGYPTFMGQFRMDGSDPLGFVAVSDPSNPVWDSSVVGDFFTPGSPFEGWYLQANDQKAENSDGRTDIQGSWVEPAANATKFEWNSTAAWNGLTVKQETQVVPHTTLVDTVVTITNTSGETVNNVYYARSVDPDQCSPHDGGSETHNVVVAQEGLGAYKSLVRASAECDGQTPTIGLASRDADSRVGNDNWGIDGREFLNGETPAPGSVIENDTGIAVAIPANPGQSNSLAPGQSVKVHFAYFLNAADEEKAGDPVTPDILSIVPPSVSGSVAGPGALFYKVNGTEGHKYVVSSTPSFHTWKKYSSGDVVKLRVALASYKKGKVGVTTLYVRDAADPTLATVEVSLPWDFSIPFITWGASRTSFAADGKTPFLGHWDILVTARDTAAPGDRRGLWAQVSYGKSKPSDRDAFPTALVKGRVIRVNGFVSRLANPVPPRWVRVEDSSGNTSKWKSLASMPFYPNTWGK